MAYFDCIVGGSGKGNTLVVTCADELAGATITCTNGTKTYTKTCPSTAPYEVTFYGLAAGTYTVSATVSGNTYTTTVVVVDCAALLGGFNWRTWVDTAQFLDSIDYDSLSEVLEDELAIRELCLEHACVDYLAAVPSVNADIETIINNDLFAKWVNLSDYALDFLGANTVIKALMDTADKYGYGEWVNNNGTWGPKGNVPIMTSNTAPYGTASASVVPYSSHPAWHAFDGNPSTAYSAGNTANAILSYKFTNPVCVKRVMFDTDKSANYSASIKTWDILAKNGASDSWEVIYSGSNDDIKIVEQEISCNQYYLYWGIKIKTSYRSESYALDTLQFYGRELWKQENSQYVPDYSEKEFEEGTTKKWLYDHGVELETITISGTGTKGTNAIQLTAANAQATASVNTTAYSLMRGKVGANASGTNQLICGSGVSNFTANNMPYSNGLDVSSVNGSNAVGVKQTAGGIFDATEFWLE